MSVLLRLLVWIIAGTILLVPRPASARYWCEDERVAATLESYRAWVEEVGAEVVEEGSKSFPVNAVLGIQFYGERGYYYEAYVSSASSGHLSLEVLDPSLQRTFGNEAMSVYTMRLPFQVRSVGQHTLAVGSIAGTPRRCVYFMIARRAM